MSISNLEVKISHQSMHDLLHLQSQAIERLDEIRKLHDKCMEDLGKISTILDKSLVMQAVSYFGKKDEPIRGKAK